MDPKFKSVRKEIQEREYILKLNIRLPSARVYTSKEVLREEMISSHLILKIAH